MGQLSQVAFRVNRNRGRSAVLSPPSFGHPVRRTHSITHPNYVTESKVQYQQIHDI
jgi:hypothetical protein